MRFGIKSLKPHSVLAELPFVAIEQECLRELIFTMALVCSSFESERRETVQTFQMVLISSFCLFLVLFLAPDYIASVFTDMVWHKIYF